MIDTEQVGYRAVVGVYSGKSSTVGTVVFECGHCTTFIVSGRSLPALGDWLRCFACTEREVG